MANVIRIGGGGAGGSTVTLPPMVTNLKAVGSNTTITVTFTNPVSDALAGVLVVYNSDHMPEKPSDGSKFDAGLTQQAVITGLTNGTQYYIRVFPYNEKKQYQTLIDGATTTARPSEGPKQVTNFQVTGSGSSPVLSWTNPTDDPTYHETVVVQKVDSPPTSLSDGTEIYRGTGETATANGLERLKNYYWGVFTINAEGGTRGPVTTEVYSFDFPEEPTEYIKIKEITSDEEYPLPEDGYFLFIAVGKSGDGGNGNVRKLGGNSKVCSSGGSGGTGSFAEYVISGFKNETYDLGVSEEKSSVKKEGSTIIEAGAGGRGGDGKPYVGSTGTAGSAGLAGTAKGVEDSKLQQGKNGKRGTSKETIGGESPGGLSVSSEYTSTYVSSEKFTTTSGVGATSRHTDAGVTQGGKGTNGKIVIYRGNTNTPSPSQVSTLSLIPHNGEIEASWTNSGDPESVGTLLVSNPTHEPQDITDGTAVDVAEATSYTLTNLPNDKPTYISLFSYNADKSKYSAAKSNVEIPREVTWADMVEEAQQEAKEAIDKAAVAEEQAKQANEMLQAKTEELAQTSAELTEKQAMVDSATATFNALIASDIQNDTKEISNNMILDNADMLSKPWEVGTPNEVGDIVWYMIGDVKQYYEVIQPTENADPNHTPNIVPAVFVAINKTNAGTIDDPIPAVRGMEYEYGKYYLDNEDGKIYICKRGEETGTIVLQYLPHELIGHYFELATLTK